MLRDHAKNANTSAVAHATMAPKVSMKSQPRVVAISGRALMARHIGQLQTVAIQSAVSATSVKGFQPLRSAG